MRVEENGANGEMELYYRNKESASTHRDQSTRISLKADDDTTVILAIEKRDANAFKGTCDTSGSRHFKMSVEDIVRLFEANGKECAWPGSS